MKQLLCLIVILGFLAAGPIAIADRNLQDNSIFASIVIAKKAKEAAQEQEKIKGGKKTGTDNKECHQQCREQHDEAVKACLDSGQKPISDCIKKANQAKKECLKGCKD